MSPVSWRTTRGDDPIVATAIHAGHDLRVEVKELMKLPEVDRLREEDPFTDLWVGIAANQVIVDNSRFELDLNRPRDRAVYLERADAWGLDVWESPVPAAVHERSLSLYDQFYAEIGQLCDEIVESHGVVVVLDLHSYNHRRQGPVAQVDDPALNPEINLGTATINPVWLPAVEVFKEAIGELPFFDAHLDVRENVKFTGGHLSKWVNARYGERGFAVAVEMKKIFMDEWSGVLDEAITGSISEILHVATDAVRGEISS